ncbi:hypothetical protein Hanom_Chr11g01044691 [Helianthus anomalus]
MLVDDEEDVTSETPEEEKVDDLMQQDENVFAHCEEGEVRRDEGLGNVDNDGVGNSHGISPGAGDVHGLAEPSGVQNVTSTAGNNCFLTPDLNQRVTAGSLDSGSIVAVHAKVNNSEAVVKQPIDLEASETLELSRALGWKT